MRYGVEVLPPFVLASARYLIAGPIMLALGANFQTEDAAEPAGVGKARDHRSADAGLRQYCGDLAEQYIPSGLAALLWRRFRCMPH